MLLIWRGWGLLAVVSLFPLLASCAGLATVEPFWVCALAVGGSLLLAGTVCVYCGTRWNRGGTGHSFYFIPLQAWGWAYLAVVGLSAVFVIVVAVSAIVQPPPGPPLPRRPDPAYTAGGGVLALVVVAATAWALVRFPRTRPGRDADAEPVVPPERIRGISRGSS